MPPTPATPPPPYRRLPGRAPLLQLDGTASARLYLGSDRLVQVVTGFSSEAYQHFAYRDVQALLLRRTARGWIYNSVFGALAGLLGVFALGANSSDGRLTLGIPAGIFLALLLLNVARGVTCRCHLQTAVGPHVLPSLSRTRPARRALDQIAGRVEIAQAAAPATPVPVPPES